MNWPLETRRRAVTACRAGRPYPETAEKLGVPRGTVSYWAHMDRVRRSEPSPLRPSACPKCDGLPLDHAAYSYLLGLYLGDGHIVDKPTQHHLSLYCCDGWPGLLDEAEAAMLAVLPGYNTGRRQKPGCTEVKSYTKHWTCLFPQHGPGMKHTRLIALEPWQQAITEEHPWPLVRGLIHSDGSRVINWTTRQLTTGPRRYEYARYFFTNKSADIRNIFTDTLDYVTVDWKQANAWNISVARKASVALMDEHIGPKY